MLDNVLTSVGDEVLSPFLQAFSPSQLRKLAGERSFDRGTGYARERRARSLRVSPLSAQGTVVGNAPYRASLGVGPGGGLEWSCSCPMGADGVFCKHCVALATVARSTPVDPDHARHL
jgi:uncharacterized Zn finger protein